MPPKPSRARLFGLRVTLAALRAAPAATSTRLRDLRLKRAEIAFFSVSGFTPLPSTFAGAWPPARQAQQAAAERRLGVVGHCRRTGEGA
jgi:hypothetical protein